MTRPVLYCTSVASALLLSISAGRADLAGPLNFETAGQLSANFRDVFNIGTASQATDSGGYAAINASQSAWISIYDTTPANQSDVSQTFAGAFKVHLEISAANANASFGLFLFDDSNRNGNNLLALLNLDTAVGGTGTEQLRFWRDTSITSTTVSNPYSIAAITGTNGAPDSGSNSWVSNAGSSGETIDTTAPYTFYSLDFTYDPTAMTLNVATPNFSATLAIPAGDVITNPGLALRINDPGLSTDAGTQKFDNFGVTAVPEPGTAALLVVGLAASLRRRRRA